MRLPSLLTKAAVAICWVPIVAVIFYVTIPLGNIQAKHFDALLVLGYPANGEGGPTPEQRVRVLEAVRQYRAGVAPVIIFSGGAAHNRFVEADVMAKLAESSGVPARAVICEPRAHNTIENVEYSTAIMQAHDWHTVEVITTPAHRRRASLILMHSPIPVNWRMQGAGWPAEYGLRVKAAHYVYEIIACAEMRIFGFNEGIGAGFGKAKLTNARQ